MGIDLQAHAAMLTPAVTVIRPAGAGPFPVVVQMHGCGGVHPMQTHYADAAREAGIAAVIVDSLGPRGIGRRQAQLTVCTGTRLRGAERAADLEAILLWLEGEAWVDTGRIAAAGWSHGAWAIMEALVMAGTQASPSSARAGRLKLAALIYPYAGPLARTGALGWGEARPRVFACLGGRDAVVGRLAPRRALARLQADGLDVDVLDLPEATHAFDDEHALDPRSRYRADLAARLRGAYAAALLEALNPP